MEPASAHRRLSIKTGIFLVMLFVGFCLNIAAVGGSFWSHGTFSSVDSNAGFLVARLTISWRLTHYQQCITKYDNGQANATTCSLIAYPDANSQFKGCEFRGSVGEYTLIATIVLFAVGTAQYIMSKCLECCYDRDVIRKWFVGVSMFAGVFGPVIALVAFATSDCYGNVTVDLAALNVTTSSSGTFTSALDTGMYAVIVAPILAACVAVDLIIEDGLQGQRETTKPKWMT